MTDTHHLDTPSGTLVYDVSGPLPPERGRPPLMLVGAPMEAAGFATLASHFPDRTVVTYDPRGQARSIRRDGRAEHTPEQNADDQYRIIVALDAGPVEMFATSGGAISALALVAAHPDAVTTLVAHEPPLLALLPDAEPAFAAERGVNDAYQRHGFGHGMAAFIALTSWQGEFTADFAAHATPDPASFGLPAEDDGARDNPLLSGVSTAITAYRPDINALTAAPTRLVVAVGAESQELLTGRAPEAVAQALGIPVTEFPGDHAGFMGGEFGQTGEPEAFAIRLRAVLDGS